MVPERCDLLKTLWLYPYEDSAPFRTKCTARKTELNERARLLNFQEQSLHDQRIQVLGKLEFMNELEAQLREAPPESMQVLFDNFAANREQWRGFVNQCSVDEQATRDSRMQVLGAADNVSYVEQTWENSARELAAQKSIIEGLENDLSTPK